METIVISKKDFDNIITGKQTQIILNKKNISVKDIVMLKNENRTLEAEITSKAKYKTLDDCFKIIPFDLFGVKSINEANEKYKEIKNIYAYRLRIENELIEEITDKELLSLIQIKTLKRNNVGHSSVNVYEVKLNNNEDAILKVQRLSSRNNLTDEYERMKWLQDKCNVPKIFYFKDNIDSKYLLMEKKNGVSAHKTNNFAFKIGKVLSEIHNINISDCKFKQNDVDNLMNNALEKLDIIYSQINEIYPDMTKQNVVDFIKKHKPNDRVLVHGDYSLPNILIDAEGKVGLIDLGDVSISTKYFDFFYLKKSMMRNKQMDKFNELLKGYGIDKLDDNYMKWVEIIDKALF